VPPAQFLIHTTYASRGNRFPSAGFGCPIHLANTAGDKLSIKDNFLTNPYDAARRSVALPFARLMTANLALMLSPPARTACGLVELTM